MDINSESLELLGFDWESDFDSSLGGSKHKNSDGWWVWFHIKTPLNGPLKQAWIRNEHWPERSSRYWSFRVGSISDIMEWLLGERKLPDRLTFEEQWQEYQNEAEFQMDALVRRAEGWRILCQGLNDQGVVTSVKWDR